MLKKSGVIVLALLYLVTVSGFALNLHYCGNLLTAVKIDAPAKGCSDPMAHQMKCCKDKQLVVKVKDAHQTGSIPVFGKLFGFELTRLHFANTAFNLQPITIAAAYDRGPPDPHLGNNTLFIKNCTFRI